MTGADTARPSVADFCGSICGFACFAAKAESNATASETCSIFASVYVFALNAYRYDALTPSQYTALLLPMSALCRKSCERNESPRTHRSHRCTEFQQLQDQHDPRHPRNQAFENPIRRSFITVR